MRIATARILMLLAFGLAAGCSSSADGAAHGISNNSAQQVAVPFDQAKKVTGGLSVKVDRVYSAENGSESGCGFIAGGGGTACTYMVTLRNDGAEPIRINPTIVALRDTRGRSYSADLEFTSRFVPVTIQPGETLTTGEFQQPGIPFRFMVSQTTTPDHLVIRGQAFAVPHLSPAQGG